MKFRKLESWVDAFVAFSVNTPSPPLLRKWAGICTVAAAIERKVWLFSQSENLYPNLYVFLVGPPGVGKTFTVHKAREFLEELKEHKVAPSSVSRASLTDALREAVRRVVRLNPSTESVLTYNSLAIFINELGTFIKDYESEFLATLTDLYDCKKYGERKRTHDISYDIPNPQLNLLASTTPAYLNMLLPPSAWEQGFLSRCILVYSGEKILNDPFTVNPLDQIGHNDLVSDLRMIGEELIGAATLTPEARDAFLVWYHGLGRPYPDHPRLMHYVTRRAAHVLKLMIIATVSRGNDLTITLDDYRTALGWLLEAEFYMPEIFKAMAHGGDAKVIKDCWYNLLREYQKSKKPIPEYKIKQYLSVVVPAYNVNTLFELMIQMRVIKEAPGPTGAPKSFIPQLDDVLL